MYLFQYIFKISTLAFLLRYDTVFSMISIYRYHDEISPTLWWYAIKLYKIYLRECNNDYLLFKRNYCDDETTMKSLQCEPKRAETKMSIKSCCCAICKSLTFGLALFWFIIIICCLWSVLSITIISHSTWRQKSKSKQNNKTKNP